MTGAGGTGGGTGQFFIGLAMMCGGIYMLLNSIVVRTNFGLGYRLYGFSSWGGNYSVTSEPLAKVPEREVAGFPQNRENRFFEVFGRISLLTVGDTQSSPKDRRYLPQPTLLGDVKDVAFGWVHSSKRTN